MMMGPLPIMRTDFISGFFGILCSLLIISPGLEETSQYKFQNQVLVFLCFEIIISKANQTLHSNFPDCFFKGAAKVRNVRKIFIGMYLK